MTPQENDMLTNLVNRLRQSPQQPRDAEAETLINDLVRARPDAPYILAQTVLIQDYSLHQAQARIADLEKQVQNQKGHEGGGFLSAIFGSGKPSQPASPPPPTYAQPAYAPPAYAQPAYAPQQAGPWGAPAQQVFGSPSGQPSFLRSAATTAAGIAGGALLFEGIESLMGGHGGGFGGGGFGGAGYGGFEPQPSLTETTINNYYEEPAGGQQSDFQPTDFDDRSADTAGGFDDSSFDTGGGGDFDGGTDV